MDLFNVVVSLRHCHILSPCSNFHPRHLVGDFVSFVEAGNVVDAASLEIDSAVLPRVDMPAEHKTRTFLDDGCQFLASHVRDPSFIRIDMGNGVMTK